MTIEDGESMDRPRLKIYPDGSGALRLGGRGVGLFDWEVDVIFALMCRPVLNRAELCDIIWPDPDHQPDCWHSGIAVRLCKLRELCEPFGFTIGYGNSQAGVSLQFASTPQPAAIKRRDDPIHEQAA